MPNAQCTTAEGLPPAQEWGASAGNMPPATGPANPHKQASPHGQDESPDLPPGHVPIDGVHGGAVPGGGPDVAAMGLKGPDPGRKINPANFVRGTIRVHMKAKDRVKDGGAVFIKVQRAVDGAPSGPPLAVDKLTWSKDGVPFELTEKQAMIAGTELTGEVVVTARFDQDSDAISKQPGDVSGSIKVKIPADKVTLTLDDVLQ